MHAPAPAPAHSRCVFECCVLLYITRTRTRTRHANNCCVVFFACRVLHTHVHVHVHAHGTSVLCFVLFCDFVSCIYDVMQLFFLLETAEALFLVCLVFVCCLCTCDDAAGWRCCQLSYIGFVLLKAIYRRRVLVTFEGAGSSLSDAVFSPSLLWLLCLPVCLSRFFFFFFVTQGLGKAAWPTGGARNSSAAATSTRGATRRTSVAASAFTCGRYFIYVLVFHVYIYSNF